MLHHKRYRRPRKAQPFQQSRPTRSCLSTRTKRSRNNVRIPALFDDHHTSRLSFPPVSSGKTHRTRDHDLLHVVRTQMGITACLILTVSLITMIFYYHPSTSNVTAAFRTVTILPEIGGRVDEVYVSRNQKVKAGEPLFRLMTANKRLRWKQPGNALQKSTPKWLSPKAIS